MGRHVTRKILRVQLDLAKVFLCTLIYSYCQYLDLILTELL
jgi:hypothetical protein